MNCLFEIIWNSTMAFRLNNTSVYSIFKKMACYFLNSNMFLLLFHILKKDCTEKSWLSPISFFFLSTAKESKSHCPLHKYKCLQSNRKNFHSSVTETIVCQLRTPFADSVLPYKMYGLHTKFMFYARFSVIPLLICSYLHTVCIL